MHTGTKIGIRGHFIAALFGAISVSVTDIAAATAGMATTGGFPMSSVSPTAEARHNAAAYLTPVRFSAGKVRQRNKDCRWCAWSGGALGSRGHFTRSSARALPASPAMTIPATFEFASLTATPSPSDAIDSPADVSEILATNIAFVSDKTVTPVRFVGAVISRLESIMNWRSNAFSIAGSRVWSKVIKFSSTGVNVRVPLN